MMRIWSVTQKKTGKTTFFSTYGAACKSINKTWPHEFPSELEVTDKTRIGFAPCPGEWIQLDAVIVHLGPMRFIV